MQKDKLRLILITIGTACLLFTAALYGLMIFKKKDFSPAQILPILVPTTIIFLMILFIVKRWQSIRTGLPIEDERSRRVMNRAAAMSFYSSLYLFLAISFFESQLARLIGAERLAADQVVSGGIAGMAIFWLAFWIYYDRKGDGKI